MNLLIASWLRSLCLFCPSRLWRHVKFSVVLVHQALWVSLPFLQYLLAIEFALIAAAGGVIAKTFCAGQSLDLAKGGNVFLVLALIEAAGALGRVCIFLFMRPQQEQFSPRVYLVVTLRRYIIYVFAQLLIAFWFYWMLAALGISKVPGMPWIGVAVLGYFRQLGLLFWLDGEQGVRGFFRSFERAANFMLYHLPFFLFLLFLNIVGDFLLASACVGGLGQPCLEVTRYFMHGNFWSIFSQGLVSYSSLFALLLRAAELVLQIQLLAFFMVWYQRYHAHYYTKSVF